MMRIIFEAELQPKECVVMTSVPGGRGGSASTLPLKSKSDYQGEQG